MLVLLVDAGNTCLKWSYLEGGEISSQQRIYYQSAKPIEAYKKLLVNQLKSCKKVVMVSVLGDAFNLEAERMTKDYSVVFKNIESRYQLANVKNSYLEPEKLGADRFVSLIAAYHLEGIGRRPCLIIDSGTATTIDAINSDGEHLGGLILPGLNLCRSSLLDNTKLLPQWNKEGLNKAPTLFAKETTEAITSASFFGLAGAIDSICRRMEKEIVSKQGDFKVGKIISGGNASQLLPYLEDDYQLHDNLIMIGLSVVLKLGEEN